MTSFDPLAGLNEVERKIVLAIERAYLDAGIEAPSRSAMAGGSKRKQELHGLLVELGRLVRLRTYEKDADVVLHEQAIEEARRALLSSFPYPERFAVKDVRDALGSTRRHIVPLMEHFDADRRYDPFG